MMIGRKIYYDKFTGYALADTGEGYILETTTEQDFASYKSLIERTPETVGMLQLEYGQYNQDFAACSGYRVALDTGELEFSYPDPNSEPNEPEVPIYQKPISEQVNELKLQLIQQSLTADDTYKSINIELVSIEELQTLKLAQLDFLCNKTILGGYESNALGSSHHYDLNYEGQINMSGIMNAINAGLVTGPVSWKTEQGSLPHTIEQMKKVYMDGLIFKQTQIETYWFLKAQVQSATSKESIDNINWN